MNFKIDSFKIRINSYEFQEILKFVKFEFSIYAAIIPTLSFLQAGCLSCCLINSVKALEA